MPVAGHEPVERIHQPIHHGKPPEGGDGTESGDSGRHLEHRLPARQPRAVGSPDVKRPGQLSWPGRIGQFVAWRQVLDRDQGQALVAVELVQPPGR